MNAARLLTPVILLATSFPARATPAVKLAYTAPAGCPSEDDFVAAVTARGADFDAPRGKPVAKVMVVSISRADNGFAGAFQVRDGGEATNKREVRGASCGEVADALAVVTAIALQGGAGDGGEAPAAAAPPPSRVADSQPSPTPAPAPSPPPAPPPKMRLRGHTPWFPTTTVTVPAGEVHFNVASSINLYGGATVGILPTLVLPHDELSIIAASFVTTPDGAQRIHGLVTKIEIGTWGPATYRTADTKTDLSLGANFAINLCVSPRYDSEGLIVLFCFGYGGGFLTLDTSTLDGTPIQTKTSGFGQGTLSGELQYYLGAGFHLQAKLGGGAAFGQITAEDAKGSRIFATQMWSADFMLGVGWRFAR
jgi:hypothetical protein